MFKYTEILYIALLKKDRRRWAAADLDGDDALTKEEFLAFLHAEEADHMHLDYLIHQCWEVYQRKYVCI